MPRIAMTHSLSDYAKCPISQHRKGLRDAMPNTTIHFKYKHNGKDYNYHVKLDRTPCHYGGYRYWYLCPHCGKRTSVLYRAGLYVCRHCIGANYQTQLNQPLDNIRRKMHKVASKLKWVEVGYKEVPLRPKGMHQKTFDRLHGYYQELEYRENLECMARFKSFCSKRGLNY
jgi:ribosomal protein L37AE/L43A